jgi:hypothetical protein
MADIHRKHDLRRPSWAERLFPAALRPLQNSPPAPFFLLLLPAIFVMGLRNDAFAQEEQVCVDVQVEGERSPAFDCLNEKLKATAQSAMPADPHAVIREVVGNGEPNKVGTFSFTATSIRMGSNFGKSAFPQRPRAVYAPASGAPHP